jgi:aspartate carbamoyltransferase catalytic subunit
MFFEASTRTQASFELAGKRLGADVMTMSMQASSLKKGETLIDTALTLNAMHPDLLVVRHPHSGAVNLLAQKVELRGPERGRRRHEHPTQALLDALTIRRRKGRLHRLSIAICGDIAHSRVARSNILLLGKMENRVRLVAPPTLLPAGVADWGVEVFHDMTEGLADVDVVMMLRLQKERMDGAFIPSEREYYHRFGLDAEKLAHAKPDAIVMHPGPMNRGVEIDGTLADDINRSVIQEQVEMGVAVRMAAMDLLARNLRADRAAARAGSWHEPPTMPRTARPARPAAPPRLLLARNTLGGAGQRPGGGRRLPPATPREVPGHDRDPRHPRARSRHRPRLRRRPPARRGACLRRRPPTPSPRPRRATTSTPPAYVDVFPVSRVAPLGLATYLAEGHGIRPKPSPPTQGPARRARGPRRRRRLRRLRPRRAHPRRGAAAPARRPVARGHSAVSFGALPRAGGAHGRPRPRPGRAPPPKPRPGTA